MNEFPAHASHFERSNQSSAHEQDAITIEDNALKDLSRVLGCKLRDQRSFQTMSAKELAERSGISNSMISKIESGQVTPSLSTLLALSKALNVTISSLFAKSDTYPKYSLVRAGDDSLSASALQTGAGSRLLGHIQSGRTYVESNLIEIDETTSPRTGLQGDGVELIYMLKGRMSLRISKDVVDLAVGDTIVFETHPMHVYESVVSGPTQYLSVTFAKRG